MVEFEKLLRKMFSTEQFHRFLRAIDESLVSELPQPDTTSAAEYFSKAVAEIVRYGHHLNDDLFDALREARPRRSKGIDEAQRDLRSAASQTGTGVPRPKCGRGGRLARGAKAIARLARILIDSPLAAMVLFVSYSTTLVVLSFVFGATDVVDTIGGVEKRTGYLDSINWWFGFGVLAPLCLFFLLLAVQNVRSLPKTLLRRGMLVVEVTEDVEDATTASADRSTRKKVGWRFLGPDAENSPFRRLPNTWRLLRVLLLFLYGLVVLACIGYWWWNSHDPVNVHSRSFIGVDRTFGMLATLMLVPLGWMIVTYVLAAIALAYTAMTLGEGTRDFSDDSTVLLVPNMDPNCSRYFGVFEDLFMNLLKALLLLILMAYLVRVWHVFLFASTEQSVYKFIVRELWMIWDFRAPDSTSLLLLIGTLYCLVMGVFLPVHLLSRLKDCIKDEWPKRDIGGVTPGPGTADLPEWQRNGVSGAKIADRLDRNDGPPGSRARFWPVGFPDWPLLLALVVLSYLSLIFCALGLVSIPAAGLVLGKRWWKKRSHKAHAGSAEQGRKDWFACAIVAGCVWCVVAMVLFFLAAHEFDRVFVVHACIVGLAAGFLSATAIKPAQLIDRISAIMVMLLAATVGIAPFAIRLLEVRVGALDTAALVGKLGEAPALVGLALLAILALVLASQTKSRES